MTNDPFEFDVALSFAKTERAIAGELAELLAARGRKVLRDEYTSTDRLGNDILDHLVNLYARKARYCVLLISRHYPLKQWTLSERTAVSQRSLRDAEEYILPVLLDDSDIPGLSDAAGTLNLRDGSLESIVNRLEQKLAETMFRPGPPSQSHDLRSGNVPDEEET